MDISQSILSFVGIVIAAIIIMLLLAKVFVSSSLDIITPPVVVSRPTSSETVSNDKELLVYDSMPQNIAFETESVDNMPLGVPKGTKPNASITSLGDSRTMAASSIYWKGGVFDLDIFFYVHNLSDRPIKLKDIKAHIYHVSMFRLPPATIPYAPRVEMAMDNTTDLQSIPNQVAPGKSQPIHLVLETSIFDTLFTTLVFGLIVYYSKDESGNSLCKLPSDRIYVFQHDHRWGTEKAHFVSRNEDEIDQIQAQTRGYQEFFKSLKRIYEIHTASISEKMKT
jgi:hypothetical protein